MSINFVDLLNRLSFERPIFHSEADFQHALAWRLQRDYPSAAIRLEYKPPQLAQRVYLDIWMSHEWQRYAIELKYKTRLLSTFVGEEEFVLQGHGAQDQGRYDFCKDISRVESVVKSGNGIQGVAIFLTNDPSYWQPSERSAADSLFRIHDGRSLSGELKWGTAASLSTTDKRGSLIIANSYSLRWRDYSSIGNLQFRWLLVEVDKA